MSGNQFWLLFLAVAFTWQSIKAVFFHASWKKRQRDLLNSMFGDGAGDGEDADEEIEAHRQFAVPVLITAACIAWFLLGKTL